MKRALLLAALLALAPPAWSYSVAYNLSNLTSNSSANVAAGVDQLELTVSDGGAGAGLNADQALFHFSHSGTGTFFITNIYFGGAALLNLQRIESSAGVNYQQYAPNNNNLGRPPGGQDIGWAQKGYTSFRFDPQGAQAKGGINAGQWLDVLFDLDNATLGDVLADLDDGDLRIAFHVQGFNDGGSEAFYNGARIPAGEDDEVMAPPSGLEPQPADVAQVPVPATLALFGVGLLGLAGRRKVRS